MSSPTCNYMKNGQHYARTHQLFSEAPSLGHICPRTSVQYRRFEP
jgi:hypothetical protein